jgi:hypothetical protein
VDEVGRTNNNSKSEAGKCQGGRERSTTLPPKRGRKFRSKDRVLSALSKGFRNPAYVPSHRFQLFTYQDGDIVPVHDFLGSDLWTIDQIIKFATERGFAILCQETCFLRKETRIQLQENRKKVYKEERDKQKAIEKISRLDLYALSGENKRVRLAYRILIDIDYKDETAPKRLVAYLRKLKIYPEVYETKDGYHIYIYFYLFHYEEGVILPYADTSWIEEVEELLKFLCAKLEIKADIISAKHAVWMEGVSNPIKDGFATKLVWEGRPLPLTILWERLLRIRPPKDPKPSHYNRGKKNQEDKVEDSLRELDRLIGGDHSTAFHALSTHGTLKACKVLLKAGYDRHDVEYELRKRLNIKRRSDGKSLQHFLDYLFKHYSTDHKHVKKQKKKERKHEHYWEFAGKVKEALEQGYTSITHIANYLSCKRSRIYHLQDFLQEHGYNLKDLLTKYDEIQSLLKEHSKGGSKPQHKKEWNKEEWFKEVDRRIEKYKERKKEEARIRREKKRKELKSKGIDPDGWRQSPVQFVPVHLGGVRIGYIPVLISKVGDGDVLTNRHFSPTNRQKTFKTPAVPLVLPSRVFTPSTQQALFDLLKRYHSDAGLPVVLIVPRKFAFVRDTLLQITPYRVPPSQLHQLWKEIKEKFGKTVQGLSTKNGALDWFLRVWEKLKDNEKGFVVVSSSPFKDKQLSATTPPDKPNKKAESKAHPKLVLPRQELFALEHLFKAHPDKKISELMPEMSESSRRVFEQVQLVLKKEFARLQKLKEKGKLPPLLPTVEAIVRFLEHSFPGLLSLSPVVFRKLLDTVLRNCEAIYGSEPVLHELKGEAGTYFEFLTAIVRLQENPKTQVPAGTHIPIAKGKELSTKKKADKKPSFPPSHVIKTVIKSFEERVQGRDVIVVSRQELETAIYTAWRSADKEKADRKAVSLYVDRFEGVLWRKLVDGRYGILVSSTTVAKKIRDYVRELKQARKNGKGQTPTNGNGSLGSELSTSQPSNGNGKYDIDQIIHTLKEKGTYLVHPSLVRDVVRELCRRGLSVNYWMATGLIELLGGDDEIPF